MTIASTDAEARERLVAFEQKVFAFGQQTEEREADVLAQIAQLEAQWGFAVEMATEFLNAIRVHPWFFLYQRIRPSVSMFFRVVSMYVHHKDR